MNILYICNEYPPGESGGIGSATRNLAKEMVKNGHRIFVAGLYIPGYGQSDYEETEGIKIWRKRIYIDIGLIRNNYSTLDSLALYLLKASGILSRSFKKGMQNFISFLQELIITCKIDIIEWPDYNECFLFTDTDILQSFLPVPIVVKLHGSHSYIKHQTGQPVDSRVFTLEKKHIHTANAIIAVSEHTAHQYAAFYHIDEKIHVIHNAVANNFTVAYKNPDTGIIVFAGSLHKHKGLVSLLQAWNTVHDRYPHAVLQVFGKGKAKKFTHILNEKAAASVLFKGFTNANSINEAFSNATAAVFPSYTECFSLAPLEAMKNGCPVIFTERASGPELIENGVNGLLVNPDNPVGIMNAITLLLSNKELCRLFSEKGYETIENKFNITKSAEVHLLLYQTVIDAYNHRNT